MQGRIKVLKCVRYRVDAPRQNIFSSLEIALSHKKKYTYSFFSQVYTLTHTNYVRVSSIFERVRNFYKNIWMDGKMCKETTLEFSKNFMGLVNRQDIRLGNAVVDMEKWTVYLPTAATS